MQTYYQKSIHCRQRGYFADIRSLAEFETYVGQDIGCWQVECAVVRGCRRPLCQGPLYAFYVYMLRLYRVLEGTLQWESVLKEPVEERQIASDTAIRVLRGMLSMSKAEPRREDIRYDSQRTQE